MPIILSPTPQQQSDFQLLSQDATPPSLLAWIPYPMSSKDEGRVLIDRLIGKYKRDHIFFDDVFIHLAGESWKSKIIQFYPTGRTQSLILRANQDESAIIPSRYRCKSPEIHNQSIGWKKLIQNIQFEKIIRVIQLNTENAELYEVINSKPTLRIRLKMAKQNRAYTMHEFSKAVQQIQKDQQGPLIIRGTGTGIDELDILSISKLNKIQHYLNNQNRSSIDVWSRQIEQCELSNNWIQEWEDMQIEHAMKFNKWTTSADSIQSELLKNRIETIAMNDTSSILFKNDAQCYSLIYQNSVQLIINSKHSTGAILK
jgi:hypothetical protein